MKLPARSISARHHYERRHSFDHLMIYSVDADEKRKEPAAKAADEKKS